MPERKNAVGLERMCAECKVKMPTTNFRKSWLKTKNKYQYCSYCYDCERNRCKETKRRARAIKAKPIESIEGEIWVDIPCFEGLYSASNMQRVMSMGRYDKNGHLKVPFIMKLPKTNGYRRVELYKDGASKLYGVHVLICAAFHPNPENKPEVNHKNGIKDCNYPWNLEWATTAENGQHAADNGLTTQIGEKGYFAKLTNNQAREIFASQLKAKELAMIYNVCIATVYQIKRGFRWKQINKKP